MANLYAPDGTLIIGTVEIIPDCTCGILDDSVTRDADGKFDFEYDGNGTEVNWDAQVTATDANGERLFWDESCRIWPESQLVLREATEEVDDDDPSPEPVEA